MAKRKRVSIRERIITAIASAFFKEIGFTISYPTQQTQPRRKPGTAKPITKANYTILLGKDGKPISIRCNDCNLTSYNKNDIEKKYCGNCHKFHESF